MSNTVLNTKKYIDVTKFRWFWIAISLLLIIPGIVAMIYSTMTYTTHTPLRVGIDFVGGTIFQYSVKGDISNEYITKLRKDLVKSGVESPVIQVLKSNNMPGEKESEKTIVSIRTKFLDQSKGSSDLQKDAEIMSIIKKDHKDAELVQVSAIGPTLGKELFKNSLIALCLAFLGIVIYLTVRFQLDYAVIAFLALLHDALFLCGIFSIFGIFYGVEIDGLFITAILTAIGFSVHDTIVVYDRIRENTKFLAKKATFSEIVNASVNQTLARSIYTSLTTLITLLALYFFGGVTTKDFVLAMIIGIAIGTYSSIFFASLMLAWHRELAEKKVRA